MEHIIYDNEHIKRLRIRAITETATGKYCGYSISYFPEDTGSVHTNIFAEAPELIGALKIKDADWQITGTAEGHGYNKEAASFAEYLKKAGSTLEKADYFHLQRGDIDRFFKALGFETNTII